MKTLLDRLRESRERWVKVDGGHELKLRRPTDLQLAEWSKLRNSDLLAHCLVDWRMKELDIVSGGGGEVPEFNAELAVEWLGDRPKALKQALDALWSMIREHGEAKEAQQKN